MKKTAFKSLLVTASSLCLLILLSASLVVAQSPTQCSDKNIKKSFNDNVNKKEKLVTKAQKNVDKSTKKVDNYATKIQVLNNQLVAGLEKLEAKRDFYDEKISDTKKAQGVQCALDVLFGGLNSIDVQKCIQKFKKIQTNYENLRNKIDTSKEKLQIKFNLQIKTTNTKVTAAQKDLTKYTNELSKTTAAFLAGVAKHNQLLASCGLPPYEP